MISGYATAQHTRAYQKKVKAAVGHFSEFPGESIKLSSIGVGTFPGEANSQVDDVIADIVSGALQNGINVIDTAAHYRYGRSLAAVGQGINEALSQGVSRQDFFLVSKGGFLCFQDGRPESFDDWFAQKIIADGLGTHDDLYENCHLLTAEYLLYQLNESRAQLGVDTLDGFLIDQPEVHIKKRGKEFVNQKLLEIFIGLENAVKHNWVRYYGISAFDGFRVATDDPRFQSLTSLLALAEKAAKKVQGTNYQGHHFRLMQMPFNLVMSEAFTRFNQVTGPGNIASTLQAAYQLNVYVMASHTLMKGHLAEPGAAVLEGDALAGVTNNAQRAIQFNRSTPGVGSTLLGMSQLAHLQDVLTVVGVPPIPRSDYLKMYQRI